MWFPLELKQTCNL